MDAETTKLITEIQMTLRDNAKDIGEIKNDMRELKECMPSLEAHQTLTQRVEKIEANLSKIVWMVLSAVIGAILLLVIRG